MCDLVPGARGLRLTRGESRRESRGASEGSRRPPACWPPSPATHGTTPHSTASLTRSHDRPMHIMPMAPHHTSSSQRSEHAAHTHPHNGRTLVVQAHTDHLTAVRTRHIGTGIATVTYTHTPQEHRACRARPRRWGGGGARGRHGSARGNTSLVDAARNNSSRTTQVE